ncbi:hypothetical protein B0T14DRAFT_588052 [Immersiella caudata]|uniref:Uncharacterized protein n=1 Tax=Immersiella caudata TaxID=314043 RepID=A0AA40BWI0_9PEZI|nr:hypothetical protein B0T14DRAFT_588052 [Immersiella caudata]
MNANDAYTSPDSEEDRRRYARLRRSEATSSDMSDAGIFNVFSVPFRVAAPPPHPLPVANLDESPECDTIKQALGTAAAAETRGILVKEGVQVISVKLTSRAPMRDGPLIHGQPTVFIVASWNGPGCSSTWTRAVTKAKCFLDSKLLNAGHRGLSLAVEIVAEELVKPKYLAPVQQELLKMGMDTQWPVIKNQVKRILAECKMEDLWTSSDTPSSVPPIRAKNRHPRRRSGLFRPRTQNLR